MTLTTLLLQLILTFPLTIMMNICKRKEINHMNKIIIPTVYILISSALFPVLKTNIFLIVIFEVFIRNFYITTITNNSLENNIVFIIESICSIALSLFAYNYFIVNVETLIPDPEEIKPFLWFLMIIYIIHLYTKYTTEKRDEKKQKNKTRKKEYTIMQYAKYKNKYYNTIKSKNKMVNDLTYAIMIYEAYKTPRFHQKIEEYIGAITKKETKYGIMRQASYIHLTDEESIRIVMDFLEKGIKNNKLKEKDLLNKLLDSYKEEEREEIVKIYKEIIEFAKK